MQLPATLADGRPAPRRIAASSVAKRIAEEWKTPQGEAVGLKVWFQDPLLSAYATIIIDEAHERSGAFRRRMSHIFVNTTHILSRIIYNSAHAHLQPA